MGLHYVNGDIVGTGVLDVYASADRDLRADAPVAEADRRRLSFVRSAWDDDQA